MRLCDFLSTLRQQAITAANQYTHTHTIPQTHISVLPQLLSPFHWKIIIRHDDNYHLADINLLPSNHQQQNPTAWLLTRMAAAYRPAVENNWQIQQQFGSDPAEIMLTREAWLHSTFAPFRTFAQFPVLGRIDISEQGQCAWFYDLRFKFPELPPSFRYGVCRQNDHSDWKITRQRGLFYFD